ncbi:hypothetical protein ABMA27_003428 [Loxostege sticticalis]|uniref:Endonuclease-reverse transcriptase n=1 Tax=Loxostege sticticalis TaxID=481309 RepID=A0ABR3HPQ5_LOXSC
MTTDTESTAVIKVRGTPLEIVNKYVYLGQEVKLGKENQETEINRRVRLVKRIANLKWQWAGHIARKSDSWCKDLLEWRPWEHKRPVGRPQMRWKDDIRKVAGQNWMLVAQDRARWKGLKEAYTKLVEEGLR